MRRCIKKAMAFAIAVATTVGSMAVGPAVYAADEKEVEDEKVVLNEQYADFQMLGDMAVFSTQTMYRRNEYNENDKIVIIDSNGKTTEISNKKEDGTAKYVNISAVKEGVIFTREDGTITFLDDDQTWIGNGNKKYKEIFQMDDDHYLVRDGESYNVIDKNENVITEDVIEDKDYYGIGISKLSDNYIIQSNIYSAGSYWESEYSILDKNLKKVDGLIPEECTYVNFRYAGGDYLIAYSQKGESVYVIDSDLNRREFKIETDENKRINTIIVDMYSYTDAFYVWVWYEDKTSDSFYVSYENLKKVSVEECTDFMSVLGSNSDLDLVLNSAKGREEIRFKDGKTVYFFSDFITIIKDKFELNLEDNQDIGLYRYAVLDDRIIVEIGCYICNEYGTRYYDSSIYFELNKKDGYTFEKAEKITAKDMDIFAYDGAIIEKEDGTKDVYSKGKFIFSSNDKVSTMYRSNFFEYFPVALCIQDKDENKTIIDFDGKEILTTTKNMEDYFKEAKIVVTYKDTEKGRLYGAIRKVTASESAATQIDKVQNSGKVEVAIDKNEPIIAGIFEKAKEKNITLVIETDSGATWTIKGSDITGTSLKDIDLTVEKVKDVVPQEVIKSVKLEGEVVELSLAHTGDFGFTAELKLNLKPENKDKYANLFYYNPTSKTLEFMESVKIDSEGLAGFKYTHASEYAIVISDNEYKVPTENTPVKDEAATDVPVKDVPATADSTDFGIVILVMLLSVGAMASSLLVKKTKN